MIILRNLSHGEKVRITAETEDAVRSHIRARNTKHQREWRARNPEKLALQQAKSGVKNKAKIAQYHAERYAKVKAAKAVLS